MINRTNVPSKAPDRSWSVQGMDSFVRRCDRSTPRCVADRCGQNLASNRLLPTDNRHRSDRLCAAEGGERNGRDDQQSLKQF